MKRITITWRCSIGRSCTRRQTRSPSDFAVPSGGERIRAIGLIEAQVVTESVQREPVVVGSVFEAHSA